MDDKKHPSGKMWSGKHMVRSMKKLTKPHTTLGIEAIRAEIKKYMKERKLGPVQGPAEAPRGSVIAMKKGIKSRMPPKKGRKSGVSKGKSSGPHRTKESRIKEYGPKG